MQNPLRSVTFITISKNALYLALSHLINGAIQFAFFLTILRLIPKSQMDIFELGRSTLEIGVGILGSALATVIVRENARDKSWWTSNAHTVRQFLRYTALSAGFILYFMLLFSAHSWIYAMVVGIFCFSIYLHSRNDMFEAYFRSLDHVITPVALSIACNISITSITLLCIYFFPYPVVWAATGVLIRWLLQGSLLGFLAKKESPTDRAMQTCKVLSYRDLIQAISPISFGAIAFIIYARIDVLMLQWMGFEDTIAIYGCAFRPIGFFSIFIAAFYHAYAPTVSRMIHQNPPKALWISLQIGAIFSFVGFILGGLLFLFSENLTALIYPSDFQDAALGMKALAWSLPIVFGGNAIGIYLVSFGHVGAIRYMWVNIIGVFVNVLGNYWIIPYYNFVGAAWITVCTDGITTFLMIFIALNIRIKK